MTIKTEFKVDKENKVLTLLVTVPEKKFARDENLTFDGANAWEAVKSYGVPGHKVVKKLSGLVVDNWRVCNHAGEYSFALEATATPKKTKVKPAQKEAEPLLTKKPQPSTQKPRSKKK
tara:strand:+ start:31 stop:384 length:354 start_codon:yes stop_codon:yes gene_type:complete